MKLSKNYAYGLRIEEAFKAKWHFEKTWLVLVYLTFPHSQNPTCIFIFFSLNQLEVLGGCCFFFLVGMKASLTLLIPLITLRQASYCVSASAFKSPQPLHLYCSGGEIWTLIWIILSCLIPFFHSLTFLPDCKFLRTKTQTEFCVLIPSWNYVLYIGGFQ